MGSQMTTVHGSMQNIPGSLNVSHRAEEKKVVDSATIKENEKEEEEELDTNKPLEVETKPEKKEQVKNQDKEQEEDQELRVEDLH